MVTAVNTQSDLSRACPQFHSLDQLLAPAAGLRVEKLAAEVASANHGVPHSTALRSGCLPDSPWRARGACKGYVCRQQGWPLPGYALLRIPIAKDLQRVSLGRVKRVVQPPVSCYKASILPIFPAFKTPGLMCPVRSYS